MRSLHCMKIGQYVAVGLIDLSPQTPEPFLAYTAAAE